MHLEFDFKLSPLYEAMQKRRCFDIEANGLLREVSLFFCAVVEDVDTGDIWFYDPTQIKEFLEKLNESHWLIGHNIIGYDFLALQKLYGYYPRPEQVIRDTVIMARMYNPNLEMHPDCPKKVWSAHAEEWKKVGPHTLMNLGYIVGVHKGDFGEDKKFDEYCPEMLTYCAQDVKVNVKVFHWLEKNMKKWSPESLCSEMEVARLIADMTNHGWPYDIEGGDQLHNGIVSEMVKLERAVHNTFGPIFKPKAMELRPKATEKTPKATKPKMLSGSSIVSAVSVKNIYGSDYLDYFREIDKGDGTCTGQFTPVVLEEFNLGSRQQIAERLQSVGYKFTKFTPKTPSGGGGSPIVDDAVLQEAAESGIPEAMLLGRFFLEQKRESMVRNWQEKYNWETGCIHGYVNSVGAVTSRMTHSNPNVAQTPASKSVEIDGAINPNDGFYVGKEGKKVKAICSESGNGYQEGDIVLVEKGVIVKKLYSDTSFRNTVEEMIAHGGGLIWGPEGDWGSDCRNLFKVKEGYTLVGADASGLELRCLAHYMGDEEYTNLILHGDIHSHNQHLAGLPTRGNAKTFIYAFLYGAGDAKIGSIVGGKSKEGKELKARFLSGLPKLKTLLDKIKYKVENQHGSTKYLKGLDGRVVRVRSPHAALNTLLQSCGAIVCKFWLIGVMRQIKKEGLEAYPVGNIHDEMQIMVLDKDVDRVKEICEGIMPLIGDYFKFRCPLEAEAKHGPTWSFTH